MKRWAALIVLLYSLMLGLLTIPLLAAFALDYRQGWVMDLSLNDILDVLRHWGYWLGLAVLVSGQAALLLVPVAAAEGRPIRRRHLLGPVLATTFFLANLVFAGAIALACALFPKDRALEWLMAPVKPGRQLLEQLPHVTSHLKVLGLGSSSGFLELVFCLGCVCLLWMIWGLVFYRFFRDAAGVGTTRRAVAWLLRGSILELLVAVPCHVVVRHRGDCCAPFATFWGITLGLSVMLMAFGPGVFFVFADRVRRLQPKPSPRK